MNPSIRQLIEHTRDRAVKGAYDGVPEVRALLQAVAFGCNDMLTYDLPTRTQWKCAIALDGALQSIRQYDQALRESEAEPEPKEPKQ